MDEAAENYKSPRWFRITGIVYCICGIAFCIAVFVIALIGGEEGVELPRILRNSLGIAAIAVGFFGVIGVPILALVHLGLKNRKKRVKLLFFLGACAWAIYFIVHGIGTLLG